MFDSTQDEKFTNKREYYISRLDQENKIYFPVDYSIDRANKKIVRPPSAWQEIRTPVNSFDNTKAIGLLTGKINDCIVIDVDSDEAQLFWDNLCKKNEHTCNTIIKTGRGFHYYYKYTPTLPQCGTKIFIDKNNKSVDIDIRSDGGFVFYPSTLHPLTKTFYDFIGIPWKFSDLIYPPEFIFKYIKRAKQVHAPIPTQVTSGDIKTDQLSNKLDLISINTFSNYDEWLKIGMAIYNLENKKEVEDGLNIWETHSKLAENYEVGCCLKKWLTFNSNRDKLLSWNYINELCIRDSPLKWSKFTRFVPHVIDDVKLESRFFNAKTKEECIEISKEFCEHFILTKEDCSYISVYNYRNKAFGEDKYWQVNKLNDVKNTFSASKKIDKEKIYLFNESFCIRVHSTNIKPGYGVLYSNKLNQKLFNLWISPAHNPQHVIDYVFSDKCENRLRWMGYTVNTALKVIDDHVKYITESESDYEWFNTYICRTLFDFNYKAVICPVIIGLSGTGKSTFIKKIYSEYFGDAFTVKDDNKFAGLGSLTNIVGKSFALIDEARLNTKEDYDKLKVLISENQILVEEKYKQSRLMLNTCNFVLCTNRHNPIKDANGTERRFCYFKVNSECLEKKDYFKFLGLPFEIFVYYFMLRILNEEGDAIDKDKFKNLKRVNLNNYKTIINSRQAEISLSPISTFIRKIINELHENDSVECFNKLRDFNYISSNDLYQLYKNFFENSHFKGNIMGPTLLMRELIDSKYFTKKKIRIPGNKSATNIFVLNDIDILIKSFKLCNGNLDPIE